MDSSRNRAMVWAQFLRNAVGTLRATDRRVDEEARAARDAALTTIEIVAEELEAAPPIDTLTGPLSTDLRNALQMLSTLDPHDVARFADDVASIETRLRKALQRLQTANGEL